MALAEKKCSQCHIVRPLSDFHKGDGADGKRPYCRECGRKSLFAWRRRNPEKYKAISRRNYHSARGQDTYYKRMYGVSKVEYDNTLAVQGGVCAACGGVNQDGRRLAVDHSHSTGIVRGILCGRCNSVLGLVDESIDTLSALISYLRK
jgi:hypothetical protein